MAQLGCAAIAALAAVIIGAFLVALAQAALPWLVLAAVAVVVVVVPIRVLVAVVGNRRFKFAPVGLSFLEEVQSVTGSSLRELGTTIRARRSSVRVTLVIVVALVLGGSWWGRWFYILMLAIPIWLGLMLSASAAGISGFGRIHVRSHWRSGRRVRSHTRRR